MAMWSYDPDQDGSPQEQYQNFLRDQQNAAKGIDPQTGLPMGGAPQQKKTPSFGGTGQSGSSGGSYAQGGAFGVAGGGTRSVGGKSSGTPNNYGNQFNNLSPQYQQMLASMGAAPQYQTSGPAGYNQTRDIQRDYGYQQRAKAAWDRSKQIQQENIGGTALKNDGRNSAYARQQYGVPEQEFQQYYNDPATRDSYLAWLRTGGRAGYSPAPQGGQAAPPLRSGGFAGPGVGSNPNGGGGYSAAYGAQTGTWLTGPNAGQPTGGNMVPFGFPQPSGPGQIGVGGGSSMANSITASMSGPAAVGGRVSTGFDPTDPYATSRAQEADRQAAIDTYAKFQQGVGNSGLARGMESLGADLAQNPESIDDATQNQIEARIIEDARNRQRDTDRELREDLGAAGRTGTGQAVSQLAENRRGNEAGLTRALMDSMIDRKKRGREEKIGSLDAAGRSFGTLAGVGGSTAKGIADIFAGTERDDKSFQNALFQMMLGAGGGFGGGLFG